MEHADRKGILFETIHRRKDGSTFPVEVSSQGTIMGNNNVLLSVIRDITDRKEVEEKLKASEANYRIIFDTAYDAIFVHDIDSGKILDVNQKMCEIYGYTREEVKQLSIEELSLGEPPYDKEHAKQFIKKAVEDKPQIFLGRGKLETGFYKWVRSSALIRSGYH